MKRSNKTKAGKEAGSRLTRQQRDERLAAHMPGILNYHAVMLADGLRNRLLYKAIKKSVTSETNFLDIGAGTGVWAILAAKLGAKRVVAVEIEECLIPIIYKHAQENGVTDRIEIVHGNSNDVKLRGRFDVIVSELFGSDALSKRVVDSFVTLRNRFLAPGGVLIPQGLASFAVPVHTDKSVDNIPANLPISCEFLRSLKLNYGWNANIDDRRRLKFLAEPKPVVVLDFRTIETAPELNLSALWKLRSIARVNAFAMFTKSTFTEAIEMDGFDSQSWGTTVYEFQPFNEKTGTIRFDLRMDEQKTICTVSVPSNPALKPITQSPAFALARMKMTQQMTPHRKVRGSKQG